MTRKRHNHLKAKAKRKFAETLGAALLATKIRLTLLRCAIETLPASNERTKIIDMVCDICKLLDATKVQMPDVRYKPLKGVK